MTYRPAALLLCLFLVGAGCEARERSARLNLVTTSLPVYSFTANIVGDLADVQNLVPPNISPHDFQLSPRDARKLSGADAIITSGLGLEDWLGRVLRRQSAPVIDSSAGLGPRRIELQDGHSHHGHNHSHWNPHYWLDPALAAHAVTNITRALQKLDPVNANAYASNAAACVERLLKLDAEIQTALAPFKGVAIVTYHDAFPYFARRYGLEIAGVVESVSDVAPSARQLSDLRRLIREKNIRVVFTESQNAPRLAERLREDFNVKLAPLDPLESGEMSPAAYEDGMRRNLDVLRKTFHAPLP